jgi:hypothetical protein
MSEEIHDMNTNIQDMKKVIKIGQDEGKAKDGEEMKKTVIERK